MGAYAINLFYPWTKANMASFCFYSSLVSVHNRRFDLVYTDIFKRWGFPSHYTAGNYNFLYVKAVKVPCAPAHRFGRV
jgi:hypothetical protein